MQKYLAVLMILILFSCNFYNQLNFDKKLTSKINLEYKEKKIPVDLTKVTDFEWDNYIIITCYQTSSNVEEKYKIDLSNISEYASSNDSKLILVFLKNKKAIKICDVEMNTEFNTTNLLKEVDLNNVEN